MKNFFQGFQGTQGGFYQNPASLAGLLVAGGKSYNDALIEAAEVSRQQQMAAMQKQQMEAAQQEAIIQAQQQKELQSRIGNLLLGRPNVSQSEIALELLNSGLDPKNIASLANALSNEQKVNDVFNPVTGEIVRKVNGQVVGYPQGMQTQTAPQSQDINTPIQAGQSLSSLNNSYGQTPAGQRDAFKSDVKKQKADAKFFEKFVEKDLRPKLEAVNNIEENINEIENALQYFKTGFGAEQKLLGQKAAGAIGLNIKSTPYGEVIDKASKNLVLDLGKKMGGVLSDKDIRFLQSAVPSLTATPEGNKKILDYYKKVVERTREYGDFAQDYYDRNGTIKGFETEFAKYKKQNNLFENENAKSNLKSISNDELINLLRGSK